MNKNLINHYIMRPNHIKLFDKMFPIKPLSGYGTITLGTAGAASVIANKVLIPPSSSVFSISAPMVVAGGTYPDYNFYKAQGVNYGNSIQANYYRFCF
jgi:hypothetical protein